MSSNKLILIPGEPTYMPERNKSEYAKELLRTVLPQAQEILALFTEQVEFIATGGNLEKISCPFCLTILMSNGGWLSWTLHILQQNLQI